MSLPWLRCYIHRQVNIDRDGTDRGEHQQFVVIWKGTTYSASSSVDTSGALEYWVALASDTLRTLEYSVFSAVDTPGEYLSTEH